MSRTVPQRGACSRRNGNPNLGANLRCRPSPKQLQCACHRHLPWLISVSLGSYAAFGNASSDCILRCGLTAPTHSRMLGNGGVTFSFFDCGAVTHTLKAQKLSR